MTAFRWPNMLDAICFLHLIQLFLDAIGRDADDLSKLFASSEDACEFHQESFLGYSCSFLGYFLGYYQRFLG